MESLIFVLTTYSDIHDLNYCSYYLYINASSVEIRSSFILGERQDRVVKPRSENSCLWLTVTANFLLKLNP